ncbi:CocE/NonD family hydrolase [Caballeronia sp. GAWG2-1]|uniref:CocE/NonD family hydrolase n=1 Tax=Caballeronia sp. GAWG2-1 TaxID=2921744 RepID=UPI0020284059|nr:CocE/NonD family hydrolase [Caballeronia sp. GAWG2-1]
MTAHTARQSIGPLTLAFRRIRNAFRPQVHLYAIPSGIHADWDVPVKVRDGTTLRVNVFRPSSGDPAPVIMSAHPYGKDMIAAHSRSGRAVDLQYRLFPQPHSIAISEWTSWEAPDPGFWVPQGYAVVNVDLRGGGTAEGIGELFSDQEARDYYDVIEWAGTQAWCSGRVALNGVSYLAISEYKVAALRPPHLAAICPWEGFSDLYRDFARPGGIREDGFTIVWDKGLKRGGVATSTRFREEIVNRPERDEWYESTVPDLERIEVPILVCGSFSDHSLHTQGSFEVFRRGGSALKSLYTHRDGKWCAFYGKEASAARLRFFDHTLKGIDNGWDSEPAVRLAIHDNGPEPVAVVGEHNWPPGDLQWRTLSLDPGCGTLIEEAPRAQATSVSFDTRRGAAQFVWTVPDDIDVIGPMALRLHLEVLGADDVFVFAGVRKFRNGVQIQFEGSFGFSGDMVSKGWQRAAHRELDERLSTSVQPVHTHRFAEPLRAGEIIPVEVALQPHATRFLKGDVLRLDIRGKWHFPRDPLRGQFPSFYEPSPKAVCVLHAGGAFDARLLIGTRLVSATTAKCDAARLRG